MTHHNHDKYQRQQVYNIYIYIYIFELPFGVCVRGVLEELIIVWIEKQNPHTPFI